MDLKTLELTWVDLILNLGFNGTRSCTLTVAYPFYSGVASGAYGPPRLLEVHSLHRKLLHQKAPLHLVYCLGNVCNGFRNKFIFVEFHLHKVGLLLHSMSRELDQDRQRSSCLLLKDSLEVPVE